MPFIKLRDVAPTLGRAPDTAPPGMLLLQLQGKDSLFYDPTDLVSQIRRWLDQASVRWGLKDSFRSLAPLCINGLIKASAGWKGPDSCYLDVSITVLHSP